MPVRNTLALWQTTSILPNSRQKVWFSDLASLPSLPGECFLHAVRQIHILHVRVINRLYRACAPHLIATDRQHRPFLKQKPTGSDDTLSIPHHGHNVNCELSRRLLSDREDATLFRFGGNGKVPAESSPAVTCWCEEAMWRRGVCRRDRCRWLRECTFCSVRPGHPA